MPYASLSPSEDNYATLFSRIGQLTRTLRDSLVNLGLDRTIIDAAEAIPDARERLNYVVQKTSQAADRALTCVEEARPLQDTLSAQAQELSARWDEWFKAHASEAGDLFNDTRQFLTLAPQIARQTNDQLTEIMMAQDFQDLTGQVIHRMMALVEMVEKELIQVLLENVPKGAGAPQEPVVTLLNGPQIDENKAGIVASQDQVDDLLDSLGF